MTKYISSKEFERVREELVLECKCGWSGTPESNQMNIHEEVMDFECPACDQMLLIVRLDDDAPSELGNKPKDVENMNFENDTHWNFTLKMSGNHADDEKKLLADLKAQFPQSYEDKLVEICIETRKEIDDLDVQRKLSMDKLQHLTNLKYDMEVFISIFRTIYKNPAITEEMMFPVEGGGHSDK